jgi:hypothetical protein
MMHMLTGKEDFIRRLNTLGGQKGMDKRWQEDAERRKQGLKTKGSKNPRKGFKRRPD